MNASTSLATIEAKLTNGLMELNEEEYQCLYQILSDSPGCNSNNNNTNDDNSRVLPPASSLASGGLVRYLGMVQDMMNPEYYVRSPSTSSLPPHQVEITHLAETLGERQPLLLVPVPFSSVWTRRPLVEDGATAASMRDSKKRDREESVNIPQEGEEGACTKKQQVRSPTSTSEFTQTGSDSKQSDQWSWPPGHMGSNPNEIPLVCHFYYELHKGVKLRLNDVVEVIGILDPVEASIPVEESMGESIWHEEQFFDNDSDQQVSQLPRLHALCYRKLDLDDLVDKTEPMETDQTLMTLLNATLGNETAAEALLMSLSSQAERETISDGNDTATLSTPVKTPYGTTLGCASLNFILPTVESCHATATQLQSLLQDLLPVVARIDLNDTGLRSPVKNGPHLVPSQLQLPRGSVIILVDYFGGGEALNSHETLEALQSMTKDHSVTYRFDGGMKFNFEADYRILVLSTKTASTRLPCTLTMKLHQQVSSRPELSENDAAHLRFRLATRRSKSNVGLGRELLDVAQHDFVNRRQQSRDRGMKLDGEEDFHRWLTLTRLCARSEGRDEATIQDWKNALRLDDAMRQLER